MMLLSILSVAFAAFCVWLIVRIVNRRERWVDISDSAGPFWMWLGP
jgi:hypothetical protein